jgi:hypothetical protein
VNPTQPPLPGPPSTRGPSTQEIPAVPVAASTGQFPSAAAAVAAQPQPTGPVDYVPGPPPTAEPPRPALTGPPTAEQDFLPGLDDEPKHRDPRARARIAADLLAVVALALLELGLLVHEGGVRLWSSVPLWSGFATLAGVLGLAVLAGSGRSHPRLGGRPWAAAVGGLAGLAVFWLLVVLPSADTDRGFLLTAALGCLGGAVWLSAGRGPHTGNA